MSLQHEETNYVKALFRAASVELHYLRVGEIPFIARENINPTPYPLPTPHRFNFIFPLVKTNLK